MTAEEYSQIEHKTPYLYEIRKGDTTLFYFGAAHSRNSENTMFSEIESQFDQFHPDLVLVEGIDDIQNRKEKNQKQIQTMTVAEIIDKGGEAAFAVALAAKNNIEYDSPEPKDAAVYNFLLESGFSKEDIFAQSILLILPQYHRQDTKNGFETYVQNFIKTFKESTNWVDFEYTYEQGMKIIEKILGKSLDVENEANPMVYVDPIAWEDRKDTQTVINKISAAIGLYRDRFMVGEIAKALKTHKKIFVVFGASHAVMQEPALRELMK
jgi:hypothetical protein